MARLFLSPGEVFGTVGTSTDVIGTNANETVFVDVTGKANFDPSFNRGGDEIILDNATPGNYQGALVGSSLVITNPGGALIRIPVGTAGTTVTFDNDSFTLLLANGAVTLGDQVITTTPTALNALGEPNAEVVAALSASAETAAPPADESNYLTLG